MLSAVLPASATGEDIQPANPNAAENAVVISTINAAVEARILSSLRDQRLEAASEFAGPTPVRRSQPKKDST